MYYLYRVSPPPPKKKKKKKNDTKIIEIGWV